MLILLQASSHIKSYTGMSLYICARPGLNFIGILRHLSGGPRLRAPVRYRGVKAAWSLGPSAIRKWLEHLSAMRAMRNPGRRVGQVSWLLLVQNLQRLAVRQQQAGGARGLDHALPART